MSLSTCLKTRLKYNLGHILSSSFRCGIFALTWKFYRFAPVLAKPHFVGITLNATWNTKALRFNLVCFELEVIPFYASLAQTTCFWNVLEFVLTPLETQKRFCSKPFCVDLGVIPFWSSLDQTTCFWNYFCLYHNYPISRVGNITK